MKTKVIAFRVTQDEYDALAFMAKQSEAKLAEFVYDCLRMPLFHAFEGLKKEQKRLEAKAKREAKKAATNVA